MRSFVEIIDFYRDKEDNWEIEEKAESLGFKNSEDLLYLGYDVDMKVEIDEDGNNIVLEINGIDVSDKYITI